MSFPLVTTPSTGDDERMATIKILALLNAGGVLGSTQIYTGAAPPAAPAHTNSAAIFYPSAAAPPGTNWKGWDIATQAWI